MLGMISRPLGLWRVRGAPQGAEPRASPVARLETWKRLGPVESSTRPMKVTRLGRDPWKARLVQVPRRPAPVEWSEQDAGQDQRETTRTDTAQDARHNPTQGKKHIQPHKTTTLLPLANQNTQLRAHLLRTRNLLLTHNIRNRNRHRVRIYTKVRTRTPPDGYGPLSYGVRRHYLVLHYNCKPVNP